MEQALVMFSGAACGFVGCLPTVLLLERNRTGKRVGLVAGLVGILTSFTLLTLSIALGYAIQREYFGMFCCALGITYLAVWSGMTLRAWLHLHARH